MSLGQFTTITRFTDKHGTNRERDRVECMNNALRILATEIFPDCQVGHLREKLQSYDHHYIEKVTEELLQERTWPERLDYAQFHRSDMIKSDRYKHQALEQLAVDFPKICKSSIRAVMAENNWDYVKSYDQLSDMGAGGFWRTLRNLIRHWKPPRISLSPSSSSSSSSSDLEIDLDHDIHIIKRRALDAQMEKDHILAQQINASIEYDTLLECGCCYGDYALEQLIYCSQGEHGFCYDCIKRFVAEGLFGQGNLRGVARIPCITVDGCDGYLQNGMLQRILPTDMWMAYERSLLEHFEGDRQMVRCQACGYAELDESLRPLHSTTLSWIVIAVRWLLMCDISNILETAYDRIACERRGTIFRCRHPECSKLTCLQCHQIVRGLHKCFEKEKDGLRLYVEQAMVDAVKRTCPVCNLSFQKADGCNKVVCQCGYAMCYVCRKDIRKESYGHFCEHFREIPGEPCRHCNKCDLYKTDPEDQAIKKAAEKARQEYLSTHPELTLSPQHYRNIGPASMRHRIDGWLQMTVLWIVKQALNMIV